MIAEYGIDSVSNVRYLRPHAVWIMRGNTVVLPEDKSSIFPRVRLPFFGQSSRSNALLIQLLDVSVFGSLGNKSLWLINPLAQR